MWRNVLLTISVVLLTLSGCSREAPPPVKKSTVPADAGDLVVVSTNDFHAALDRAEGLASAVKSLRKRYGNRMIYLDAGDQFQGSLEGNISKGKAVVGYFNLIGLDAAAIGNHEFDYGPDVPHRITVFKGEDGLGTLKKRVGEATYPMLSANFVVDPPVSCEPGPKCNAIGMKTLFEPRTIIEQEDNRIGIIGATTQLTRNITSPAFLEGTTFLELTQVVQEEAKFLRETAKCNWVLLVIHSGLKYEPDGKTIKSGELLSFLKNIRSDALDAVVGGHSHEPAMEVISGIPVIQTGSSGKRLGVLHLTRKEGKREHRFDPFVTVPDTGVVFEVTEFMKPYRLLALEKKREKLGTANVELKTDRFKETAIGNLVADAILAAGQKASSADFALVNGGALREQLLAGTITYSQLFKLLPYDDNLVVAELTGNELRTLIEISASGSLGLPLISGLQITLHGTVPVEPGKWTRDLDGDNVHHDWERNLVLDVKDHKGRAIDGKRTYKVATLSYLVEGGDYHEFVYDNVPPSRIDFHNEVLVREAVAEFIQANSPIEPDRYYSPENARIKFKD